MKIKIKYDRFDEDSGSRFAANIIIDGKEYDLKEAERLGHLILDRVREARLSIHNDLVEDFGNVAQ